MAFISAFSEDAANNLLAKTKLIRTTGGYSSCIGDTSALKRIYTPQPIAIKCEKETTKEFEYSFEFGCSDTTIKMMHRDFALAKAENENAITSWEQADTKQGTRYTALCAFDEPKLNDRQRIFERTNEGRVERS
ncbi:hypothetical protein P3666_23460 [Vibrio parahaemolyticus]|uniref:hypothetical protein n=1 Tax=Vibrio parahaemolyticus TaxID=670 RepID=UPI00046F6A1D|nr:hypothetical protein [Vibrio parahaemolyticus]MCZ5870395.1 hypothetical protein [Vibrio parahaemolyticus]MCZ5900739.1 hypothetical protein [Vibrio parahaemolyticus]MCZ6023477.1 hypothetical protein [Vibrio parahaemolyticus]MCZ6309035.1 hypothetical protein [Vibrio parahaemolyticus]MDF4424475.1 hypothetical protein [Vibrio parahaemolyticus]